MSPGRVYAVPAISIFCLARYSDTLSHVLFFDMKRTILFALFALSCVTLGYLGSPRAHANPQSVDRLDAAGLKTMVMGFGYEIKELSGEVDKEKWEIQTKTEALNIPVACELSASKNYIWLTVSFGDAPKADSPGSAAKYEKLLKATFASQPSHFYITTKGFLMLGIAIENRAVTPADLRRSLDKIVADVGKTQDAWGSGD